MNCMMKKIISLILAVSMAASLCACGGKPGGMEGSAQASETEAVSEAATEAVTEPETPGENQVLDGAGIIKDLPADPSSATIASVYAVSVPFIVALGLSDRTVAVNPKTKFWTKADEKLSKKSVGRGVVDLEVLASLDPTVLIHRSNDPETVKAVENLGVSVLCITVENMDDIESTLTMMGKYFGVSERAEEVIAWEKGKFDYVKSIVDKIPEAERKKALLMGGELGRVSGNDMLQSWMIEQAGGICVVDEGEDHNWINVGVEKVFAWNPDYIFCTSSTALEYDESDMANDPAWSAVQAVKDGNIYTIPAKTDSWDIPGLSCVIGTMYMLHTMYPEYFTAEELQEEVDEYYTFMFGKTFSGDEIGYTLE